MKTQLKFIVVALVCNGVTACSPPQPPSVDSSTRRPVNSPKVAENIALKSEAITRQLMLRGDRQAPTLDEQNARLRAQVAFLDDKLHRNGVAYDLTVFIPVKNEHIAPDAGQQTQLTSSLNVSRGIEITASSSKVAEETRAYLILNGASPACITVTISNFSPYYVGVLLTYF